MTKPDLEKEILSDLDNFNNICDECYNEDESVKNNLILTGFKLCKSCQISKTIFRIFLIEKSISRFKHAKKALKKTTKKQTESTEKPFGK